MTRLKGSSSTAILLVRSVPLINIDDASENSFILSSYLNLTSFSFQCSSFLQMFHTQMEGGVHNSPHPSDMARNKTCTTRGGDSVAWADDASIGATNASNFVRGNNDRQHSRNLRKLSDNKNKSGLTAAQILKHAAIRSVLLLQRVPQNSFIDTLISHSQAGALRCANA